MSFLPKEPKDLFFLVIAIKDSKQDVLHLEKALNEIWGARAQDINIFELEDEQTFVSDDDILLHQQRLITSSPIVLPRALTKERLLVIITNIIIKYN